MEMTGAKAYLVNTGWNGSGKRISIKDTRGIIDAILDGSIDKAPTRLFLSSILLFRQNFRVLIRRSLILAILMLIQHSGTKKQKILQVVSSRTSLNSLETKLVRSWLLLDRNSNQTKLTTLNNRKATLKRVAFLFCPVPHKNLPTKKSLLN